MVEPVYSCEYLEAMIIMVADRQTGSQAARQAGWDGSGAAAENLHLETTTMKLTERPRELTGNDMGF